MESRPSDGGAEPSEPWTAEAASDAAADSSTCSVSQSFEAVEAGALEALEAGAARIRAALDSAGVVSTDGMRAAFLSREDWLPGTNLARAAALAGLSLQPSTSRSDEPTYTAASIDGQQDVSELSAALALTQQLLARQREETSYYKALAGQNPALDGAAPPPMEGSAQQELLQQAEAAARALRVELARTREALAATSAKHDALLAECDRLRAERDAAEAARAEVAAQHAALVDERDELLEERDALRVQVYSPGVYVDAGISPLRAAAAELNAHFRSKSGASVRTGELVDDAGGPSGLSAAALLTQSGSPRRGSGRATSDGPDGTVSRLLARMGLSGENAKTAE